MEINNVLRASDYRARARDSLKDKYWKAVAITLLASLLMGGAISLNLNYGTNEETIAEDLSALPFSFSISEEYIPVIAGIFATVFTFVFIIVVVRFILTGVTEMGLARYNIKLCMGEEANVKDLFAYYKTRFGTGVLATFLTYLFVSLWSMLFVVPGIVASYKYALVPYLLAEDDALGAYAAIKKSTELMKGNKWKLFCLDISFIGWLILGIMACGIGVHFVNPYINNARAHFYCELVGKNNAVEIDENAQELDYTSAQENTDTL